MVSGSSRLHGGGRIVPCPRGGRRGDGPREPSKDDGASERRPARAPAGGISGYFPAGWLRTELFFLLFPLFSFVSFFDFCPLIFSPFSSPFFLPFHVFLPFLFFFFSFLFPTADTANRDPWLVCNQAKTSIMSGTAPPHNPAGSSTSFAPCFCFRPAIFPALSDQQLTVIPDTRPVVSDTQTSS